MRRLLLPLLAPAALAAAAPPVYVAVPEAESPLAGVGVGTFSAAALADLDADGTLDLLAGAEGGTLFFFENTGSATAPLFTALTGTDDPLGGVDVGEFSAPAFVDLDGDGDLDLVVGEHFTAFHYFENVGTRVAPAFVERSGAANPLAAFSLSGYSTAALADVDGDGDLDFASGAPSGAFHSYENTGTPAAPVFVERTGMASPFHGLATAAAFSTTAFANLYDDAAPALVAGSASGAFAIFRAPEPGAGLLAAANAAALGFLALRRRR